MRVLLVDACPIFREGLKTIMNSLKDVKVVGEAATYREVWEQISKESDLLIVDGDLEALGLLRKLDKVHHLGYPPFVLVLSAQTDNHHATQFLAAGADGYLSKLTPPGPITEAIRHVLRGRRYVSAEVSERILMDLGRKNAPRRLSHREYEVLSLLAYGLRVSEIAEKLSLSIKTISTYRVRLLEKLHLRTNGQLMRYAYMQGMMSEERRTTP
jgi:two-component system invasion response regulator UvrY